MPSQETPRQILFALCWRGGEGALEKIKGLYDSKQVKVDEVDDNNVTALRFAGRSKMLSCIVDCFLTYLLYT